MVNFKSGDPAELPFQLNPFFMSFCTTFDKIWSGTPQLSAELTVALAKFVTELSQAGYSHLAFECLF